LGAIPTCKPGDGSQDLDQGAGDNAGRDFDALFRERYADLRALADQRRRQDQRGTLLDTTAAHPPSGRAGPWAHREPEIGTAVVSISDLNLSTATDIQEACQRIPSTANRLCHRLINDNMVAAQVLYEECAPRSRCGRHAASSRRNPARR